eukprot:1846134-Rhodomonas_salina.1
MSNRICSVRHLLSTLTTDSQHPASANKTLCTLHPLSSILALASPLTDCEPTRRYGDGSRHPLWPEVL